MQVFRLPLACFEPGTARGKTRGRMKPSGANNALYRSAAQQKIMLLKNI
jgi:hypothetical protein